MLVPQTRDELDLVADDALVGDDSHLALYCCYELAYRGFADVDDLEWDPALLTFRGLLEERFEGALRAEIAADAQALPTVGDAAQVIDGLLDDFAGPSLSQHMVEHGDADQLREFFVHRSAYQLKEADPHTWAIPRLPVGARRSAFLEIQTDEYGSGLPDDAHAEVFAGALASAGLDDRYGAYLDRLPGVTLATTNLITMFGLHRRLLGAAVGHLAVFEMTSVVPMGRYRDAAARLGFDERVQRFFTIHVEADEHHGALARATLLGGDPVEDGIDPRTIVFGARALLNVEDRFARHLLDSWAEGRSSLLPPAPASAAVELAAAG